MTDKVRAFIGAEKLIMPAQSVLVAFSGGADSMTLLSVLVELRETEQWGEIAAAHLHHGLRGIEADRDEEAVRDFCQLLGVQLFVEHADVAAEATKRHQGIEETGRQMRYAFLQKIAEREGFDLIATAHTQNDQAETLLLHITRGCGTDALAGIPPKRGNIIRPLLTCSRKEIEAYCVRRGLDFVTDSTNADTAYTRNRVRHRVIPELESINPRVGEALTRLAAAAREDAAYWREQTDRALTEAAIDTDLYDAARLAALPLALQGRVLHRIAGEGAQECHIRQLQTILPLGGAVTLPEGIVLTVRQGYLTLERGEDFTPMPPQPLIPGKTYQFGADTYRCRVLERNLFEKKRKVHKILLQFTCDYDKIRGVAAVRTRLPGDGYTPYRRGGYKSLKKFLNENRVPASRRDSIPLIVDEDGIVLVAGLGCDERAAIDDATRYILIFTKEE